MTWASPSNQGIKNYRNILDSWINTILSNLPYHNALNLISLELWLWPVTRNQWLFCVGMANMSSCYLCTLESMPAQSAECKRSRNGGTMLLLFFRSNFADMWTCVISQTGRQSCHLNCTSAPLSKNAVSAFQISCKLLSFTLKDSWRN